MPDIANLYEYLRDLQLKPYFFGLGFIQVKVNQHERYHFYHESLSPIVNHEEEVHDHRYDFDSTVLKGAILNKKYMWTPCDKLYAKHYMKNESCNQAIKLSEEENPDIFGNAELLSTALIKENVTYHMGHMELHTVAAKNCITHLRRSDYKKELSRVVRPIGGYVICPFSQPLTPDACWDLIKSMTTGR